MSVSFKFDQGPNMRPTWPHPEGFSPLRRGEGVAPAADLDGGKPEPCILQFFWLFQLFNGLTVLRI